MACMFKNICNKFNEDAAYCVRNYEVLNCDKAMDIRKAILKTMAMRGSGVI